MDFFKLMIDFGLLVLIWIIQLVVYPGLLYFDPKKFLEWHKKYTLLISSIVAPMMFAQLFLHFRFIMKHPGFFSYLAILLIISNWIMTFGWAIPLHSKIKKGIKVQYHTKELISMNKYRTAAWTATYIISLGQFILI